MLRIVNNSEIGQLPGDKAIAELLNVRFNSFMQALAQQAVPAEKRGVFMKQAAAVLSAAGIEQEAPRPERPRVVIPEKAVRVDIPESAMPTTINDPQETELAVAGIMDEIRKLTDACCLDLVQIAEAGGPKKYTSNIGPAGENEYAVQIIQDNGAVILDARMRYFFTMGGVCFKVSASGKFQQDPTSFPRTVEAIKVLRENLKTK